MVSRVKTVGVVQCRTSSSRLPAKVFLDLSGKTILERVLLRTSKATVIDEIWVATSVHQLDDLVETHARELGVNVFRGALNNVLDRFCGCVELCSADIIVRITADNPLTETKMIDCSVSYLIENTCDYVSFQNIPYGSSVETFTRNALFRANSNATTDEEREHVTLHMVKNPDDFKVKLLDPPWEELRRPDVRVTVDTMEDYYNVRTFYDRYVSSDSLENYIKFFDMRSAR